MQKMLVHWCTGKNMSGKQTIPTSFVILFEQPGNYFEVR
jgi:hypothetical protein